MENIIKLSFSNIAWTQENDPEMYAFLASNGYSGVEIAPTRIFPDSPYQKLDDARNFAEGLKNEYGLNIPSMQSIWYGMTENIFSPDGFDSLAAYTRQAIDFAEAVGCPSLVFGNPKNRNIPEDNAKERATEIARQFFAEIGSYAKSRKCTIALEPNPSIYGTNFINTTPDAIAFIDNIDGLSLNIDFGTIIENDESLQFVENSLHLVSHIHISEPNLVEIKERQIHQGLHEILQRGGYDKFVSVEMKNPGDLEVVKRVAGYIKEVFE